MILLLDNYDSFVYNLDRYFRCLGQRTLVLRSDAVTMAAIQEMGCSAIVISPGPKTPDQSGISLEVIRRLSTSIPILGVCLGHQAVGQALGGSIIRAPKPFHGRSSRIERCGDSRLLCGFPESFIAARYHSLMIDPASLPDSLRVTAKTADGLIMAIEHVSRPLFGVQFHPESVLSEYGYQLLANFLLQANLEYPSRIPKSDLDCPDLE